eukprot:289269-Heterocapsa_arctica.AAC.1
MAVPPWSCLYEIWNDLILRALNFEGNQQDPDLRTWCSYLKTIISPVHMTTTIPFKWNTSWGAQPPKFNGKARCATFRLIHLLDPI